MSAVDDLGPPPPIPTLIDRVVINAVPGAKSRTIDELSRSVKAAGGVLTVQPNSSAYIVAVNNGLRFSVVQAGQGNFEIRENQTYLYLIGAAVLAGVLLLSRR